MGSNRLDLRRGKHYNHAGTCSDTHRVSSMIERTQTKILPTHTPALFETAVSHAAELLRAGEVVALPTETVYGLAANALDANAVARIYEAKGRPAHNPVIVHVADETMARRCAAEWPDLASRLAMAFWPGPLTMVLPRSREIPDIVTAGGGTVGVRWPSHPFMQAVIRACGFPLAAPSANPSNRISPTNAAHVQQSLGDRIPLIVDGGQSQVGIESTVLDLTVSPPCVLRPGMIHDESLIAVTGKLGSRKPEAGGRKPEAGGQQSEAGAAETLRSPGMLRKHYAPRARLVLLLWNDERELDSGIAECGAPAERTHVIAHTRIPMTGKYGGVSVIPHDPEAFARAIYAELHRCDETQPALIVVEELPDKPEWRAIADRLARAAG